MALPCSNMNLNLYRIFYIVAKTKSFSESSKALHISQPAISKHIQNLEYELNTTLFYRTNRGIEVTPEAKKILQYVEKAYNDLMLGERELLEELEQSKGTITIGYANNLNPNYLNDKLKEYMALNPNVSITIENSNYQRLIDRLNQHLVDMIIIPEIEDSNKIVKKQKIATDKYVFIYNSKKAEYESINTLEELLRKPLLLPNKDTIERKKLDCFLDIKNIKAKAIMEFNNIDNILKYTKDCMGIGFLPKSILKDYPDLKEVQLLDEFPEENIELVYHESNITKLSRELIKTIVGEEQPQ